MNKDHKVERKSLSFHVTSNTPVNTLKNKINLSQTQSSSFLYSSQSSTISQSTKSDNLTTNGNSNSNNYSEISSSNLLNQKSIKSNLLKPSEAPLKKRSNADRTPLKDKNSIYEDLSPLAITTSSINPFKVPTNLNMNKNKKIAKSFENGDNILLSQTQNNNKDIFSMSQSQSIVKSKLFDSSQMSIGATQDFIKSKIDLSQSQRGILLSPNDEFVKLMTQSQNFCTPMDQAIQPRGLDMLREDMVVSKHEHKASLSSKLVKTAEVDRLAQNFDSCCILFYIQLFLYCSVVNFAAF